MEYVAWIFLAGGFAIALTRPLEAIARTLEEMLHELRDVRSALEDAASQLSSIEYEMQRTRKDRNTFTLD